MMTDASQVSFVIAYKGVNTKPFVGIINDYNKHIMLYRIRISHYCELCTCIDLLKVTLRTLPDCIKGSGKVLHHEYCLRDDLDRLDSGR